MERPLLSMLEAYAARQPFRGHMPGHKGKAFLPDIFSLDITELSFSDELYNPSGPLLGAEVLLAQAAGANKAKMLTGGSSQGIYALLYAAAGKTLLVSRCCHRSVAFACALWDITPVFVEKGEPQPYSQPSQEDFLHALALHPETAAVLVTTPDYFGRATPMDKLAQAAGEHPFLLLDDEAHGAHLPYYNAAPSLRALPQSAGKWAHGWVQSYHKTLPALGQAALLCANSETLFETAAGALPMVSTSSPSYAILASMEAARLAMQQADLPAFLQRVFALREQINELPGLCAEDFLQGDPTRLVVNTRGRCSGLLAANSLERAGVFCEARAENRLVFILSPFDPPYQPLLRALRALPPSPPDPPVLLPPAGKRVLPVRFASLQPKEWLPPEQAIGRVAAGCLGPYPPGVPTVWPGEEIGESILNLRQQDAFGLLNGMLPVIK